MTGRPTVQVLLDDGTGTFPYDVTSKARMVEGYKFKRGRQDELSSVTNGDFELVFDNTDGRFTVGSTIIASPSPIKMDAQIRVIVTPGANLLSAVNASFEAGIGTWAFNTLLGSRTAGTSLASSAVRATDGTKSLLATWSTSASGNFAAVSVATVVGQQYTFTADVYVPTGSPNVRLIAGVIGSGATITTKDAWVRTSVSFTATNTTTLVGVDAPGPTTAGQTCFLDSGVFAPGLVALAYEAPGTPVTRFTQFVQNWAVEWPEGGDEFAVAAITGTDAQAKAEGRTLASLLRESCPPTALQFLYPLGEPVNSASAADVSGNQRPALLPKDQGANLVFGSNLLPSESGVKFAGGVSGDFLLGQAAEAAPKGVMLVFARSGALSVDEALVVKSDDDPLGTTLFFLGITNKLRLRTPSLSINLSGTFTGDVTAGALHIVEAVESPVGTLTLWFDGVAVASGAGNMPLSGTLALGGDPKGAGTAQVFSGTMGYYAAFTVAPTAAEVQDRAAILAGTLVERSDLRVSRLASFAGVPVGTLDVGLTSIPLTDLAGQSAWSSIQDVADAEMGIAFIDGSGNTAFHNRNRVLAKTAPDVTIDANFLAPGTRFEYDMFGVLNYFEVTASATGVKQVVWNQASEVTNKHGRYPTSKTYLVPTDAEALDRANWIVATHAEPAARVGSLVVDVMTMTATQQAQMLTVEPDTWLRVTGLPGQTPGGTVADFIIQGLGDSLSASDWALTLNAANKAALYPSVWILGTSALGVDTRLAV